MKRFKNSISASFNSFNLPEEEWISFRTGDIIERLNKVFKRRTKPMETAADAGVLSDAFRIRRPENETAQQVELNRESAQKSHFLEPFGAAVNLHKTLDTIVGMLDHGLSVPEGMILSEKLVFANVESKNNYW